MIPIVDLSPLEPLHCNISIFKETIAKELAKRFRDALQMYGFLYIKGHGINEEYIEAAFKASKAFFDPKNHEIHKRFYRRKGVMLGYVDGLNERDLPENPVDLKQGFDFVLNCPEFEAVPNEEKEPIKKLYQEFEKLSLFVQRFLALCLEVDDLDYFVKGHQRMGDIKENSSTMRILYYKAINGDVLEEQSRMSRHTDFGTFTMLLQDDVGGLQVLSPCENHFIDATPMKNALVFNVGDLLQIWSQRKLKSTLHQVVIPKDMIRLKKSRQAIAFFTNPDNDYVITSVDENGGTVANSVREHIKERNDTTIVDDEMDY